MFKVFRMIIWVCLLVTGWKVGDYHESQQSDKTDTWYLVSTVGFLGIVIEFLFAIFW